MRVAVRPLCFPLLVLCALAATSVRPAIGDDQISLSDVADAAPKNSSVAEIEKSDVAESSEVEKPNREAANSTNVVAKPSLNSTEPEESSEPNRTDEPKKAESGNTESPKNSTAQSIAANQSHRGDAELPKVADSTAVIVAAPRLSTNTSWPKKRPTEDFDSVEERHPKSPLPEKSAEAVPVKAESGNSTAQLLVADFNGNNSKVAAEEPEVVAEQSVPEKSDSEAEESLNGNEDSAESRKSENSTEPVDNLGLPLVPQHPLAENTKSQPNKTAENPFPSNQSSQNPPKAAEQRTKPPTPKSTTPATPTTSPPSKPKSTVSPQPPPAKRAKPRPFEGQPFSGSEETEIFLRKKELGNRTEEEVIPPLTREQADATRSTTNAPRLTTKAAVGTSTQKAKETAEKREESLKSASIEENRSRKNPAAAEPTSGLVVKERSEKDEEGGGGGGKNNATERLAAANSPAATTAAADDEEKMLLVEQHAIDLIPLKDLLSGMLVALSSGFMIIGGAIPYVFQYAEIHKRKSATGFSLLVCLALCVANILRILFWFGKRFELTLLIQSVVMIACMLLMLEISVRMNKKIVPPSQRKSIWKGDIIDGFWKWNDLSSFVAALVVFTIISSIITFLFTHIPIYVEALGMVALLSEACLALPQLIRNFQRRSTQGMSVNMVLMWLIGDLGKTLYFVLRNNPAQFWICSSLQITIDILILGQVYFYNRSSARIPTYTPANQNNKL